ncbi:hypothetical protein BOTBODRAFT_48661 [Botryobasidium botryosum FD-172 SS1]|uniref:BTB domain-containing protein n=1 Tax=Botryobasidium botryosum (strain FD-172 SS1) TaxID=930990 RepID=A0A067M7T0_BOTB1|nr:hypothetical protein BOTBODRAFT_48661 [Botryobasidium botryosum FD-172 SS1]
MSFTPPAENETTSPAPALERYPGCYFEDDFVVLAVGPKPSHFKISRTILNFSEKLRSMLEKSSSNSADDVAEGASDEHPVRLPEDDPEHFAGVMRVYHSKYQIPRPEVLSFEYLTGTLRVANKYGFTHAVDWAAGVLRTTWSPQSNAWLKTIANPAQNDFKHAIELINTCRGLQIPDLLEGAYYLLCTDNRWCKGKMLYPVMEPADYILLHLGATGLRELFAERMRGKVVFAQDPVSNPNPDLGARKAWEDFIVKSDVMRKVFAMMGFGELDDPQPSAPMPAAAEPDADSVPPPTPTPRCGFAKPTPSNPPTPPNTAPPILASFSFANLVSTDKSPFAMPEGGQSKPLFTAPPGYKPIKASKKA